MDRRPNKSQKSSNKDPKKISIQKQPLKKQKLGQYLPVSTVNPSQKNRKNTKMTKTQYQNAQKNQLFDTLLLPTEAGFLEAEGMEKTSKFSQQEIVEAVDLQTKQKAFDLNLETFGPYYLDYTRNGRFLLLAGKKGHISVLDWKKKKLETELNVKETIKDVKFLHNETLFAVAQKKYTFIYDQQGVEIHRLKKHLYSNKLEFLPYHWLLVSIGESGMLRYQDTSTGELVSEHRTRLGPCQVMKQNPHNAIIHLGHHNGTVTLWSPNMGTSLVTMLCHRAAVTNVAISSLNSFYMYTSGLDRTLKLWDMRKYEPVFTWHKKEPITCLQNSQRDLIAMASGPRIQIWKGSVVEQESEPYMQEFISSSQISSLSFCPFEDILGVGHSKGFKSMIVPGSGEPNFDTLEVNPYQTKNQRREWEIHALLDKLQPDMITLGQEFGSIKTQEESVQPEEEEAEEEESQSKDEKEPNSDEETQETQETQDTKPEKRKARGKSKIGRKHKNIQKQRWEKVKREAQQSDQTHKHSKLNNQQTSYDPFARFQKAMSGK